MAKEVADLKQSNIRLVRIKLGDVLLAPVFDVSGVHIVTSFPLQ